MLNSSTVIKQSCQAVQSNTSTQHFRKFSCVTWEENVFDAHLCSADKLCQSFCVVDDGSDMRKMDFAAVFPGFIMHHTNHLINTQ